MIITIALLVFIVAHAGLSALFSRKYSWIISLIRTGVIAASVIIAGFVSKALMNVLSETLFSLLVSDNSTVAEFMEAIPASREALLALPGILLAPILFVPVFLLIRRILDIIVSVVAKFLPLDKEHKWISIGIGALNGLLVALVLLMPLSGYVMVVDHASDIVEQADMKESLEDSVEGLDVDVLQETAEDPVLVADYYTVGAPLFRWMTTTTVSTPTEFELNLENEVCSLTSAACYTVSAIDALNNSTFTTNDRDDLITAGDELLKSVLVRQIMSEAVSAVATQWKDDKPFVGIERPEANEIFTPFFDEFYRLLAEENSDNIDEDLATLLRVVGDIFASNVLDTSDPRAILNNMGKTDLLTQINATLSANDHLRPLRGELNSLSMRAMATALGTRPVDDEQYDVLLNEVSNTLSTIQNLPPEEQKQVVTETVQNAFSDYGVEVPADVAVSASEMLIEEFGSKENITPEELENYLVEHIVGQLAQDESGTPEFDWGSLPDDLDSVLKP